MDSRKKACPNECCKTHRKKNVVKIIQSLVKQGGCTTVSYTHLHKGRSEGSGVAIPSNVRTET